MRKRILSKTEMLKAEALKQEAAGFQRFSFQAFSFYFETLPPLVDFPFFYREKTYGWLLRIVGFPGG
jgi:hypothetical protein